MTDNSNQEVRPDVLNYDDIRRMVPRLDGHPRLVNALLKFLSIDKVNRAHANSCSEPGPKCTERLLFQEFHNTLRVDNAQLLDHLPEGPFITVSNHPFGAPRRNCFDLPDWFAPPKIPRHGQHDTQLHHRHAPQLHSR